MIETRNNTGDAAILVHCRESLGLSFRHFMERVIIRNPEVW